MSASVLSTEMPVSLGHYWLHGAIPRILRLVPCFYNHWYRRNSLRVLAERKPDMVRQAWVQSDVPLSLVGTVSAAVADEYWWPRGALFHPNDECRVLFCFWRRALADSLELPCCIMRIEQELGVQIPDHILPRLHEMSFEDLCRELVQLLQVPPSQ